MIRKLKDMASNVKAKITYLLEEDNSGENAFETLKQDYTKTWEKVGKSRLTHKLLFFLKPKCLLIYVLLGILGLTGTFSGWVLDLTEFISKIVTFFLGLF